MKRAVSGGELAAAVQASVPVAGRVVRVDLDDTPARLGVPVEEVDRVHRLAGDRPSAALPAKADAPAIPERLAVRPDDAAEIMAGWPDPDSPLWTPQLRWLLDRTTRDCQPSKGRPPLVLAARPLPYVVDAAGSTPSAGRTG